MPTLFLANPIWGDQRTIHYRENTSFTITFVTEKAAVEPYMPPGIVVPDDPLVMVTYCTCRGIKEMGGTGYNLVSVSVAARYEGEVDQFDGDLSLVIWENKFPPVVMGREFLGYPKLVVEIDDPWMGEDKARRTHELYLRMGFEVLAEPCEDPAFSWRLPVLPLALDCRAAAAHWPTSRPSLYRFFTSPEPLIDHGGET